MLPHRVAMDQLLLLLELCIATRVSTRIFQGPPISFQVLYLIISCNSPMFLLNPVLSVGATVAVECKDGESPRPSFRLQVKSNKHGEFRVRLPFPVSKHVKQIEGCSVKLIKSSEPYCAVASSATSSSLHLESRKQGAHVFSAGVFTFKPLKQPFLCNQKPSVDSLKQLKNKPPPLSIHPNQLLPPPLLPPNPLQPPPLLPLNPLQPPPLLSPNPLQPPPAPLVPNPLQPPPAPVTPSLPPIPGLTPPPSPPPSPSPGFPFPLPPFPFTPVPPFPGVPPAKSQ